jgi:hypothetical protein
MKVPKKRQRPQLDSEKNKQYLLQKHADKLLEQDQKNKKLSEKLLNQDIFTIFNEEETNKGYEREEGTNGEDQV